MTKESIDTSSHIQNILEAIGELLRLHARTAAPAPIPHQYVGTVVDNTIGLLTAPANALENGVRRIHFSEARNWLSLMQAVHRSFFSSLQLAIEAGLQAICRERGLKVSSRLRESMESAIGKIESVADDNEVVHRGIRDLRNFIKTYRPGFDDYLESVLTTVSLTRKTKVQWRRFFRGLSIVRNKASHSDTSLTDPERKALIEGGCGAMISKSGDLVMNPKMYLQFVTFALQFLDLICSRAAPTTGIDSQIEQKLSRTIAVSMDTKNIRKLLAAAVIAFEENDAYLLREDLNERTISHRFALHLQEVFPTFHVDCEYNRAHGRPKELNIPRENVSWEDTEAKTVFPDIIVHIRDTGPNILVVEMKKLGRDCFFDEMKLQAYCKDHAYQEAALLMIRTGNGNPGFETPRYYTNEVR